MTSLLQPHIFFTIWRSLFTLVSHHKGMRKPPGPKNRYPLEILFKVQRDPLSFFEQNSALYPDYFSWTAGPQRVWALTRPDLTQKILTGHPTHFEKGRALQRSRVLLGNGLLTAEGEEHLQHRRALQPAFRKDRIRRYAEVMMEETSSLLRAWPDSQTVEVDIHQEMMDLALSIVARTLLGQSLSEDLRDDIGIALEQALGGFRISILPFFDLLRKLPLKVVRNFESSRDQLHRIVMELVDQADPESSDSILSLLPDATRQQKLDHALTLLLAGHETTANAMTFAIYLLGRHPAALAQVEGELDHVLQGRAPTSSDYPKLKYLRNVMEETLRLFPPAWMVGRKNLVPLEIDGYQVKPGSILLAPQWLMHRDSRYFASPDQFRPERWDEQTPEKGAYFPFGGGTRVCIGEGFARMEAVLILAALLQKYRPTLLSRHELEVYAGITLRPKDGLKVRFTPRAQQKPSPRHNSTPHGEGLKYEAHSGCPIGAGRISGG